jgi:hypothetical protein
MPHKTADQDFGLLQAVDERLAMYGWLTNTGVKFVAIVDMEGRPATSNDPKVSAALGIRDADLKPVSACYCQLWAAVQVDSGVKLTIVGLSSTTERLYQSTTESFL